MQKRDRTVRVCCVHIGRLHLKNARQWGCGWLQAQRERASTCTIFAVCTTPWTSSKSKSYALQCLALQMAMESLFVDVDGPCCIPPTYPTAYSPESTGSAQPSRCARGVTGRQTAARIEQFRGWARHSIAHLRAYRARLSFPARNRPVKLCECTRVRLLMLAWTVLVVVEEMCLVSPSPGTSRHLPHRGSRHRLMSGAKNESALRDVLDRPEAYLGGRAREATSKTPQCEQMSSQQEPTK